MEEPLVVLAETLGSKHLVFVLAKTSDRRLEVNANHLRPVMSGFNGNLQTSCDSFQSLRLGNKINEKRKLSQHL
jgi:hypothetical protein